MTPRPLPEHAQQRCLGLSAPARLVAHLTLVHDVAFDLLSGIDETFSGLTIDRAAVRFGAATHDLGKVLHPEELIGPGHRHEESGPSLLERQGVPPTFARFARTHGRWRRDEGLTIEDLLVALADSAWKGQRHEDLETRIAGLIARETRTDAWSAYASLDELVEGVAHGAEARLAWQAGR